MAIANIEDQSAAAESLPLSQRRFLALDDAAEYVSVSKRSLYRLIEAGKLRAHRPVPGRVVVDRLELESLCTATSALRKGRGHAMAAARL